MIGGAGRDCEEGFVSVLGESSEDIGCDLFCLDLEEELAGFWLGIGVCLVLEFIQKGGLLLFNVNRFLGGFFLFS